MYDTEIIRSSLLKVEIAIDRILERRYGHERYYSTSLFRY